MLLHAPLILARDELHHFEFGIARTAFMDFRERHSVRDFADIRLQLRRIHPDLAFLILRDRRREGYGKIASRPENDLFEAGTGHRQKLRLFRITMRTVHPRLILAVQINTDLARVFMVGRQQQRFASRHPVPVAKQIKFHSHWSYLS